jgi:hypothetical protein
MMTKLLIALAIGVLFIAAHNATAQTTSRIKFARGKSSAVVRGSTGSYGVSYIVRAKAGQKMAVTLTPVRGVGMRVNTDGGGYVLLNVDKGDGPYELDLPESGDYEILIGSVSHRSIPFTLVVKITK